MKYLSLEEVIYLHEKIISVTGGKPGIHDFGLLHSAIEQPKASFGGDDLYSDIFYKAAALVYSLINNHPFVDGNKRTAAIAMIRFLNINNVIIKINNQELVDLCLKIESKKMNIENIAHWLEKRSK